ncbi:MAG TPA: ATP-binding cassette domain-containing protein, partial [Anaerolineae bacterium]|nr:ATP-binding cassette domain-containing protein [Anaerolineae bacterium]
MVFQNYALYPHMRVYDNIAFGLMARKMPKDEIDQRVRRAAQMLGIEELLHRRPRELSGGQQQRVAIGRAIVREPNVFLFDEPLSNLDAKLRVDMRTELLRLHREIRTTVIYVTHDQEEAMTLGDRIIIMNYGVVMQAGSPREVYYRPQNRFVASFIGSPSMNMIPGRFESGMFLGEEIRLPVSDEVVPSREVLLGVRPEDVYIQGTLPSERETQPVEMMLEVIELLGARAILSLARGSLSLKAVVEERVLESIREGDLIPVTFDRQRLHFFDAQSEKRIALGMESKNEREIVTKVGHD